MNHRSLVFQLAAWHTLLLGAVFVLAGATSFLVLHHYLKANIVDSNTRRLALGRAYPARRPRRRDRRIDRTRHRNATRTGIQQPLCACHPRQGRTGVRSGAPANHSFDPAGVPPTGTAEAVDPQQLMINALTVPAPSGEYRVEVGVSVAMLDEVLRHMRALLMLLLPVLLVFAAAAATCSSAGRCAPSTR